VILTLTRTWINLLSTGEAISAATVRGSRTQVYNNAVEVRTYANGRRRSIAAVGEDGEISFQLTLLDQATKDKLRTWASQAVQVRDWRGQKWFGVFANVDVGEYTPATLYSATLTLMTTTTVEGV
jgi:hypothetical protein